MSPDRWTGQRTEECRELQVGSETSRRERRLRPVVRKGERETALQPGLPRVHPICEAESIWIGSEHDWIGHYPCRGHSSSTANSFKYPRTSESITVVLRVVCSLGGHSWGGVRDGCPTVGMVSERVCTASVGPGGRLCDRQSLFVSGPPGLRSTRRPDDQPEPDRARRYAGELNVGDE